MATKWGVLSAGKISHDFVTAVRSIPGNDHEVFHLLYYTENPFKMRCQLL